MSNSASDILANCGFIRRTVFLSMFFIILACALSCSGSASAICDWAAFHSCSLKFIVYSCDRGDFLMRVRAALAATGAVGVRLACCACVDDG